MVRDKEYNRFLVESIDPVVKNSHPLAKIKTICNTVAMVNRMRANKSHRNNRRSHHALVAARVSKCSNCSAPHRCHTVCINCGYYNGRKVLDLAAKALKKTKTSASK